MARVLWSGSTTAYTMARIVSLGDREPLVVEYQSVDSLGETAWVRLDQDFYEHVLAAAVRDLAMSATRENGR